MRITPRWLRWGLIIPPAIDPGRAQQTRPRRSRSFVRWALHLDRRGLARSLAGWADGRRDDQGAMTCADAPTLRLLPPGHAVRDQPDNPAAKLFSIISFRITISLPNHCLSQ